MVDRETFEYANLRTGEHHKSKIDLSKKGARDPFGKRWLKLSRIAPAKLSTLGLTATEYNVLMQLIASIEDRNQAYVKQAAIAKEIGSHQSNVSLALKRLQLLDVVRKTEATSGRFMIYEINPSYAWNGGDRMRHQQEIRQWTSSAQSASLSRLSMAS